MKTLPMVARWPGVIKPGAATAELISGEDIAPTFIEAAGAMAPREMSGHSFLKLLRGQRFEGRDSIFAERGSHATGLPKNTAAFDLARCVVTRTHKLIYNAMPHLPYTPVDFSGQKFWHELRSMSEAGKLSPAMSQMYFSPTRPMFELYDLQADPGELHNLADDKKNAKLLRSMKGQLQEWMILNRDFLPLPIPKGGNSDPLETAE